MSLLTSEAAVLPNILGGPQLAPADAVASLLLGEAVKMDRGSSQVPAEIARILDKFIEIRVDDVTEDEYWVWENIPCVSEFKMLRRRRTVEETLFGGLGAGAVVELLVAFLYHPFDTLKTRLQAEPGRSALRLTSFARLYDGFGPVALTVPVLSVFWAARDALRKLIVAAVPEDAKGLPAALLNSLTVTGASVLAESVYWAVKTPSQVIKTRQQAELAERELAEAEGRAYQGPGRPLSPEELLQESLKAWPVLAVADVPFVGLRVLFFSALHESGMLGSGVGEDALQFALANTLAVLLATPLDVVRTQMLLRGSSITELPAVVEAIYEKDGAVAFVAGWPVRLLWNGAILGITLGLVRQIYTDVRAAFLVNILDQVEDTDYVTIFRDVIFSLPVLKS